MNIYGKFAIMILVFVTTLTVVYRVIPSVSGANLTCIDGNITKSGNQSINLSMMNEGYFRNLNSDNPQLAQLICQDILNQTTK